MRIRFTVPLKKRIQVKKPVIKGKKASSNPVKIAKQTKSRLESRLESRMAARVMRFLNETIAGKAEIAKHLGHQTASGELHKQVKKLLDVGFIEYTIRNKPNSRLQKYLLTKKGRDVLDSLADNSI